jgi:hypothetical protein
MENVRSRRELSLPEKRLVLYICRPKCVHKPEQESTGAGPETAGFRFHLRLAGFFWTGTGSFKGKFSVCRNLLETTIYEGTRHLSISDDGNEYDPSHTQMLRCDPPPPYVTQHLILK